MDIWKHYEPLSEYCKQLIRKAGNKKFDMSECTGYAAETIMIFIERKTDQSTSFADLKREIAKLFVAECREYIHARIDSSGRITDPHGATDRSIKETIKYCSVCREPLHLSQFCVNKQGFNYYVKPFCKRCEYAKYKERLANRDTFDIQNLSDRYIKRLLRSQGKPNTIENIEQKRNEVRARRALKQK